MCTLCHHLEQWHLSGGLWWQTLHQSPSFLLASPCQNYPYLGPVWETITVIGSNQTPVNMNKQRLTIEQITHTDYNHITHSLSVTLRKLKSSRVIFLSRLLGSSMGMLLARTGAGIEGEELSGSPFSVEVLGGRRLPCWKYNNMSICRTICEIFCHQSQACTQTKGHLMHQRVRNDALSHGDGLHATYLTA